MALVNLTEAAKLVGITRKTIGRHVQSGKLSVQMIDNAPKVDTSELLRVYGSFKQINKSNLSNDSSNDTKQEKSIEEVGQNNSKTELAMAKKELEILRLLLTEKDRHIDTLKDEILHTRLLLEDKSVTSKKPWWKLFS